MAPQGLRGVAALILCLLATALAGCAPSALTSTRQEIAAGRYAEAHRQLLALLAHPEQLSPAELREARDGLCLIEHMVGAPAYRLSEQRRVCQAAAREPGSRSAPLLAKIEGEMRNAAARRVEQALRDNDVVEAEQAAIEYQELPGPDFELMGRWAGRMWQIVHQRDLDRSPRRRRAVRRTIAHLRGKYAKERRMNREAFVSWVASQGTVNGTPIFSHVAFGHAKITVLVRQSDLRLATLNLVRFTVVNDAMAARCGCDAHTEVSVAQTHFPLYVVRLDPETRRSEVLILPHR